VSIHMLASTNALVLVAVHCVALRCVALHCVVLQGKEAWESLGPWFKGPTHPVVR